MSLTPEQILASHKANVETLFGLTSKAFEGVEKLIELNVTASRAALNDAASHAQAVLSAKDVQELDAWWEQWSADYARKNAKLGGTSISMSRYWFEVQKAQYENARREIEMQERIQQSAAVRRGNAGPGAAGQPGGGATYVSNITLPGGKTAQVRFADSASQSAAEQLLRELAQAKGAAS